MIYAESFFGPEHKNAFPLSFYVTVPFGKPMTITAADDEGHMGTAQTQFIVERARKHALDETVVRKQVDRLGNTEFFFRELAPYVR